MWQDVRAHAARLPDALAVADPDTALSWQELISSVETRASQLAADPAVAASIVALHRQSDVRWVVDYLALRMLDRCVLALPAAQPATSADSSAAAAGAGGIVRDGTSRALDGSGTDPLPAGTQLIHTTSGTTGKARGVPRSAENIRDEAEAVASALRLGPGAGILCATPVSHSFASGLLMAALLTGAPTLLMPGFSPTALTALARRYAPAILAGTPYVFHSLTDARRPGRLTLPGLRTPLCGGAPLHEAWARQFQAATGAAICQEYGLSEGGIATVNLDASRTRPTSVGRPIRGVRIAVVDDTGRALPAGSPGRVVIDRPAQPRQYLGPDGRLDPIPVAGPAVDGPIDTGDLGYLDDVGRLYLTGRLKSLINVAGAKVDAGQLEGHLVMHPEVADAVVVGLADPYRGESVAAMVEVRPGTVTTAELVEFLRGHVAGYAQPRRWSLTEQIPRTASGKPDRHRIKRILEGL
jgi:long-chain acyl-CoA synthetase